MKKKIVIAGGTGLIGRYFKQEFEKLGFEVLIISRMKNQINWDNKKQIIAALESAEMLINLAGKSVDCRYNEKNKQAIFDSRLKTTNILGEAVLACKNPPELWINSSTATIYRHAEDYPMTEKDGDIGSGFSVDVATSWEATFFGFKPKHTRQIALRTAIVLSKEAGVIRAFKNLVRFGLGGQQGNGKQFFSWIHIADLFAIVQFLKSRKDLSGVFNCSAPNPVQNKRLMSIFRKTMHMLLGLPAPKFLLEIGAFFLRTEIELLLKSRWVLPKRLVENGFTFQFEQIEFALEDILNN